MLLAAGGALLQLCREDMEDKTPCPCCLEDGEMLHNCFAKFEGTTAVQLLA